MNFPIPTWLRRGTSKAATPSETKHGRGRLHGILVGVLALAAVTAVAYWRLVGWSATEGADVSQPVAAGKKTTAADAPAQAKVPAIIPGFHDPIVVGPCNL